MMHATDFNNRLIVESLVLAKKRKNNAPCEDVAGMQGNAFWVLDSAGTPERWQFEGQDLPAYKLAKAIDDAFKAILFMAPKVSLPELLSRARQNAFTQIRDRHPEATFERLLTCVPHAAVTIVRIHENHLEYATIQDTSLLVKAGPGGAPLELRDPRQECFNAAYYAAINKALTEEGVHGPQYNALLDEMVDRERGHRNVKGGFFTFTAVATVEHFAQYGTVAITPGAKIVLASDGAARYWNVFNQPKPDLFSLDLDEIAQSVRTFERQDPEARYYPRIGLEDDFTLLRITLT